ncbi:LOW QUALITY PROTEIN: hypothetical protein YC2023_091525 [Brassica napus]
MGDARGERCRLGGAKSVLGTPLQSAVNASLVHILKYLTGSAKRPKTYANLTQVYVDVRNVALGHVVVYDTQRLRPLGVRPRRMRGQSLTSSLFKSLQEKCHLHLPQDSNQNNVIVESLNMIPLPTIDSDHTYIKYLSKVIRLI